MRVFARLGDYQHKQRNRMKFMIKTLGWTRWREEYDRELTACRLRGQVPTLEIDPPASEGKPDWVKDASPSAGQIASRVADGRVSGPGLTPDHRSADRSPATNRIARWRVTNVRAAEAVRLRDGGRERAARRRVERADAGARRVGARVRRRRRSASRRIRICVFRWVNACDVRQLYRRLAAAGLGLSEAGTVADVTSCPGAETCRLAVTQSRGLGTTARGSPACAAGSHRLGRRGAHQDQRLPERLRSASHRDHRIPGQRAPPRFPRRAAVFRDGRRRGAGARRHVRPARRQDPGAPHARGRRAADRAVRPRQAARRNRGVLLRSRRSRRRQDACWRTSNVCSPGDAVPLDFVDLGEIREFVARGAGRRVLGLNHPMWIHRCAILAVRTERLCYSQASDNRIRASSRVAEG